MPKDGNQVIVLVGLNPNNYGLPFSPSLCEKIILQLIRFSRAISTFRNRQDFNLDLGRRSTNSELRIHLRAIQRPLSREGNHPPE